MKFAADFAQRVNALIADPAKAAQFGKAGRKRALEAFAWPAIAEQTSRCTGASWPSPSSGVAVSFKQTIAANDALRTGTYSKTLTFTLSTTTP